MGLTSTYAWKLSQRWVRSTPYRNLWLKQCLLLRSNLSLLKPSILWHRNPTSYMPSSYEHPNNMRYWNHLSTSLSCFLRPPWQSISEDAYPGHSWILASSCWRGWSDRPSPSSYSRLWSSTTKCNHLFHNHSSGRDHIQSLKSWRLFADWHSRSDSQKSGSYHQWLPKWATYSMVLNSRNNDSVVGPYFHRVWVSRRVREDEHCRMRAAPSCKADSWGWSSSVSDMVHLFDRSLIGVEPVIQWDLSRRCRDHLASYRSAGSSQRCRRRWSWQLKRKVCVRRREVNMKFVQLCIKSYLRIGWFARSASFAVYSSILDWGHFPSVSGSCSLCCRINWVGSFITGYSIPVRGRFSILRFYCAGVALLKRREAAFPRWFWMFKGTELLR